ncbi:YdbH family protein [Intestinirhabdus alba]|jgi:hypothetical protein|uniref:YdbH family protein n=1 Tax=Intestinirhabdus alba TaxID=2899544 RepID=A0A6L6ITM9_9ENTR|nr:YdbH family protein [Intestinirhabdus alba]MTH48400.1 YdbH family protein [Intestinirhabdus alba]
MKGICKAILALVLLLIVVLLTLLLTFGYWLPTLAGIWLPQGTRIALAERPQISRHGLSVPDLRYLVDDCPLARVSGASLRRSGRWLLNVGELELDSACLAKLPQTEASPVAPRTLAQWQSMLPNTTVTVDKAILAPWQAWQGSLTLSLTPAVQQFRYQGEKVKLQGQLRGQTLTLSELEVAAFADRPPVKLVGEFTLPLVPDGLPVSGRAVATLSLPQSASPVNAELEWKQNAGQLVVMARESADPLLDLPWNVTRQRLTISDGRWTWPYQGIPLSGRLGIKIENWQEGLEGATIDGRLNVLTQGKAGKGNAVLSFGPGRLSMEESAMPLQLTGEAKHEDLIFYARLPARLGGSLSDPQLSFSSGALLRSRGRAIESLSVDEIRWPLAGVKLSRRGMDGRLQAILRAHEKQAGNFVLHLDGQAHDFLPDAGRWQWRYWGSGHFTPMRARWDVAGKGEWRDSVITLSALSTGFDRLQYGTMTMETPRLVLKRPVIWRRDAAGPDFSGALALDAGKTTFSGGSVLPPSTLTFSVQGRDPTRFQFRGALHAGAIGPVRVNGRWDGVRLRGQAWWPKQSLAVFQPLLPPDWKMTLREGELYAQVAFSAAAGQGFEAGGHGVLKGGSAWMPDNQINGVDFTLPFRFHEGTWLLGSRGPVSLRVGEVVNQVTATELTADLQGSYPWSEERPLLLSDVSVKLLGGKIAMRQLRMPQRDPALLRVENISTSELISAINPKQFALSGPVSGALPLWLNDEKWIVKDGWLTNPGPLTLRLDKDTADAIIKDNMAAGAAIGWLRYMEIARSWTKINLDNLGRLTLQSAIVGNSHVDGKVGTVNLNYTHEENVFTLWRSLRFGDNLRAWLEQNAALPDSRCPSGKKCEESQ